jgi:DNA mismatch repair ATPase MutS
LAATHDIELTTLLASEYENYHFEESFIDNDIHFPYKILPGAATTRNAIKLLRVMGYDEALVKEAEKMTEGGI